MTYFIGEKLLKGGYVRERESKICWKMWEAALGAQEVHNFVPLSEILTPMEEPKGIEGLGTSMNKQMGFKLGCKFTNDKFRVSNAHLHASRVQGPFYGRSAFSIYGRSKVQK
ncbi:hypothetical protein ACFE04_021542 [Oxalis oulophora]